MNEIREKGKLLFDSETNCYINQLNTKEIEKIPRSKFKGWLADQKLTLEEYYGLIMYGDKSHKEYCSHGHQLPFKSLSHPYPGYCEECQKELNSKEIQEYREQVHISEYISDTEEYARQRIKFLAKEIKPTGNKYDVIIKLLQKNNLNHNKLIDLCNKKLIPYEYTKESYVRRILESYGFLGYEVNLILKNFNESRR